MPIAISDVEESPENVAIIYLILCRDNYDKIIIGMNIIVFTVTNFSIYATLRIVNFVLADEYNRLGAFLLSGLF